MYVCSLTTSYLCECTEARLYSSLYICCTGNIYFSYQSNLLIPLRFIHLFSQLSTQTSLFWNISGEKLSWAWNHTFISRHLRQCILFVSDWQSMELSVRADSKQLNQTRTLVYWLPAGLPCTNLPGGLLSNQCTNQSIHNWSVKFLTSTLWHLTKVSIVINFSIFLFTISGITVK